MSMRSRARHPARGLAIFLTISAAALSSAAAGGFHSPYQSATAAGAAFAGASARADDPGFFLYNPAAISGIDRAQSWTDTRAFFPDASIEPTIGTDALGQNLSADGSSGNLAGNALALGSVTVVPIGEGLVLGMGSSAPFATSIETSPDWAGRYHLLKAHMVGLNATAALSWQATDWLAVAAGAQLQRLETEFGNRALVPSATGIADRRSWLEASPSWQLGAVAGLVLTPAEGTRVGIGWRSAMTHAIEGKAGTNSAADRIERLRFDIDLPQTLSLGLEQRLTPTLRLFAEVQWVDWSRFKGFDISFASGRPNELRPIDWRDTWLYAGGIGVTIAPGTEITAGISHDTAAAIDASGTTLSADASRTTIGLGLLTEVASIGKVSVSYAHVIVHEADVFASHVASGTLEGKLHGRLDTVGASVTVPW